MSAGEPKRGKAGRSAQAVAERQKTFVEAYLSNGHNAAQAAIAAGTGGKYQKPAVQALLAKRAKEIAELVEMNTQNGAEELRAIAFSDVGDLVDDRGKPIPMSELPPHVRAAISSVKVTPDGKVIEYKFWDKPGALQTMARHLGLFEKDNARQQPPVLVKVELVG